MKMLFVIPRMGGGGSERVLANLANTMVRQGHEVTLMTIVGGESFYPLDQGVRYCSAEVTVNRSNRITLLLTEAVGFLKSFLFFRKTIRKCQPDFVLSKQRQADIICYFVKKSGVAFKHVCHEINDPFVRPDLTKKVLKRVYADSHLLICQTQIVADFYHMVGNRKVIPNPVDPSVIPKRILPKRRRVVAVGRLDGQKNFAMLIGAFGLVLKEIPDCRLDIYGEGPLRRSLQQQIDDAGIGEHVNLCGARSDVLEQICDASVFAMSSDYEGMPNALLEAMAIGLPVVSTDFRTGVARELIAPENGRVVPLNDAKAFAEALVEVLSSETICDTAAICSPEKLKAFYNEAVMHRWIETFESV